DEISANVGGSGTVAFTTSVKRSGASALSCSSDAGNGTPTSTYGAQITGVLGRTYYHRSYLRFDALPSGTTRVLRVGSSGRFSARLTSGGKLQLFNDAAGTQI